MAGCSSVRTSKMKAHCSSLAKPRSGVRFYVSGHIKASKAMPHTCLSDCGNAVMIIIIIIIITHCSHFKKKNNNNTALAESYVTGSAREAGAAAQLTDSHKEEKYANIGSQYLFAPIAVETLGPLNTSACQLFGNLGRKISSSSGEGAFLFQRVSVLVQRFNAVLFHDSLPTSDCTD